MKSCKILLRIDTFELLRNFFLQGFPYYDKYNKHLPNLYDSNDENNIPFKIYIKLKNTLFCFFTEQINNLTQDLICILSDIMFGITSEQISYIKSKIINKNKELNILKEKNIKKYEIEKENNFFNYYNMKCSILNISPFICNFQEILQENQTLIISSKIIENFHFIYDCQYIMKFNDINNNFLTAIEEKLDLTKIVIKMSYRDLILFLKLYNYYSYNLEKQKDKIMELKTYNKMKQYYEDLYKKEEIKKNKLEKNKLRDNIKNKLNKNHSNNNLILVKNNNINIKDININNKSSSNNQLINIMLINEKIENNSNLNNNKVKNIENKHIIDNNEQYKYISIESLDLILIDNDSNTYYPFLSFILNDFKLNYSILKNNNILDNKFLLKILIYNYYAGVWEPCLEKNYFNIKYETISNNYTNFYINLNEINFNISDLYIIFLNNTLKNWIEKYYKLKENYKENLILFSEEKKLIISNHTFFNYTGKVLNVFKNETQKKLFSLNPNENFEMEYDSSLIQDNCIEFDIDNEQVSNNNINIDNMQTKKHIILNNEKNNYVISKIEFHNLKKFIYFYSPLWFKNKTDFNFIVNFSITINNKKEEEKHVLNSKKIIGIPFEYLNGEINFQIENKNIIKSFKISEFFKKNKIEVNFSNDKNNLFINFNKTSSIYNQINIRNSYVFRNCLPFIILLKLNDSEKIYPIKKNEIKTFNNISIFNDLYLQVYFYEFKTEKKYIINKNSIPIYLFDLKKNYIKIYISKFGNNIIFHTNNILINHSNLNLFFKIGKEDYKVIHNVPNQNEKNNYFLLNEEKYLKISYKDYKSNPIQINTIGTNYIIPLINKKNYRKIEVILDVSLSLVAKDLNLYTNIITILPRYIIINKLDIDIDIKIGTNRKEIQKYSKNYYEEIIININKYDKKPIYFSEISPNEINNYFNINDDINFIYYNNLMYIKPKYYEYSSPYSTDLGNSTLICKNEIDDKLYINIEKKIDKLITYIIIKPTTYENSQFIIKNNTKEIYLQLYQETFIEDNIIVPPFSSSLFSFSNLLNNLILNISFYYKNNIYLNSKFKYKLEDRVIFDFKYNENKKYPLEQEIKIYNQRNKGNLFILKIDFDGNKFLINIYNKKDIYKEEGEDTNIITNFSLNIKRFNISLIGDNKYLKKHQYNRYEICLISIKDISFFLKINVKKNEIQRDYQLVIKDFELDNEMDYITRFPIIFLPTKSYRKQILNENKINNENEVFLNLALFVYKKNNQKLTYIRLFNYLIQSFEIKIESNLLIGIINFISNISNGLSTSYTNINPIFLNETKIKDFYFEELWISSDLENKLIENENKIYIKELNIDSLEFNLTFMTQNYDEVFEKILSTNKLISILLTTCGNIDNVPIFLSGKSIENFEGSWEQLLSNIYEIYRQSFLIQIMKIIGSLDILGNPVNLIDNFTTGFKDLVNKPIQGIKISAKEGVVGLYKGVVSFTTHTIGGTLNTTSKITDGLSKGMLMLSQDDKYIQERETKKICERPNNVLEGCAYGLNSLSNGVYEGVKGLITKPVEGIKENDLAGLGKGIVQGIGGFFFKPISGVFDFVSKTTEGIKMSFKSDNVNIKRLRSSRPFYRKNKIIKNINLIDIQNIEYLQKFIKNKKINIDFYNSISYLNRHNNEIIIIFLNTGIFVIDKNIDEELLELKYEYIKEIVNENTKIKIFFKKKINNKFYVKIEITNNNENPVLLTKKIISKFQNSITMYNEEKNII